jgi:AcrR family transcriptional regulator
LAKGSLYVHFENKEALSLYVVDYNLTNFAYKMLEAINVVTSAKDKLFAMLDFLSDPVHHPVEGGCPMINFGSEADDTNPLVRTKVVSAMYESIGLIENIINSGKADGEFSPEWNANTFAVKMYALIEGGVMMCRVMGDSKNMGIIIEGLKSEIEAETA